MLTFRYLLIVFAALAFFSGFAMFVMAIFAGSVTDIADSVYIIAVGIVTAQIEELI